MYAINFMITDIYFINFCKLQEVVIHLFTCVLAMRAGLDLAVRMQIVRGNLIVMTMAGAITLLTHLRVCVMMDGSI